MSSKKVEILEALIPAADTDLAALLRDEGLFASTAELLAQIMHPDVEAVPAWRGAGVTYSGLEGFREMWLDWLQPWATYHVQVDEMIEAGDTVVVLVRDRGRRYDMDVEVELISGSVWTFREGKIARVEFHANREEVRAATGFG